MTMPFLGVLLASSAAQAGADTLPEGEAAPARPDNSHTHGSGPQGDG